MQIKRIDIIHHSHVDYGYTDHPTVVRELQKRYIDMALDMVSATKDNKPGEKFCWTSEILEPVWEWWKEADDKRREQLLKAVQVGQFEVCGFVFNNTPFLNEDQWDKLFRWIPDELWDKLKIQAAMQTDVNGIPLAGVMRAAKKGIKYIWAGPNSYLGSVPFKQPSAFKWLMPDGCEILVWLNSGYSNAHYLFNDNWRQGPVPMAADLRYRNPVKGDIFRSDRESVLKAHKKCLENIRIMEAAPEMQAGIKQGRQIENTQFSSSGGYEYDILPISLTNQWRIDNDPPFLPIVDFIAKWNELGLEPELRLTTPSIAMKELEARTGGKIQTYNGEWVDWWAKGSLSAPPDMAAARKAKRIIKALKSPVFNGIKIDESIKDKAMRELCMFDEHTWGSWGSVAYPYSTASRGEMAEKSTLAYRPLAISELLLSDAARLKLDNSPDGLYAVNASSFPVQDWIELPADCLRGYNRDCHEEGKVFIKDTESGEARELFYMKGAENFARPEKPEDFSPENVSRTFSDNVENKKVRFWSGVVKPGCVKYYEFIDEACKALPGEIQKTSLQMSLDRTGWPSSVEWEQMLLPLFKEGFGEFISFKSGGLSPRWTIKDIFSTENDDERSKKIQEQITGEACEYDAAYISSDTPWMKAFDQAFTHPSLVWGRRTLELWKYEPRARLRLRINRRPSMDPEMFFVKFPLPCEGSVPFISNGGHVFKPGEGQLPGSCMDYYAIDGWVHYQSEQGSWLWSGRDSSVVTLGKPMIADKIKKLPENTEMLYAMIFDNTWDTNFVADSHGVMEFTFDLVWRKEGIEGSEAARLAESVSNDLLVLVKSR